VGLKLGQRCIGRIGEINEEESNRAPMLGELTPFLFILLSLLFQSLCICQWILWPFASDEKGLGQGFGILRVMR